MLVASYPAHSHLQYLIACSTNTGCGNDLGTRLTDQSVCLSVSQSLNLGQLQRIDQAIFGVNFSSQSNEIPVQISRISVLDRLQMLPVTFQKLAFHS